MKNTQQNYIIGAGLSGEGFDYVFTTALNKTEANQDIKKIFNQLFYIDKEIKEFGFSKPSHFAPKDIKKLFIYGISIEAYFNSKFPLETIIKVQKLVNGCYVDDTNSFKTLISLQHKAYNTKLQKVKVKSMSKNPKIVFVSFKTPFKIIKPKKL